MFVVLRHFQLFVLCCGLDTGNCNGTDNVFVAAASGQVINWLGQSLGDRAISFGFGKSLGNLVCDISSSSGQGK